MTLGKCLVWQVAALVLLHPGLTLCLVTKTLLFFFTLSCFSCFSESLSSQHWTDYFESGFFLAKLGSSCCYLFQPPTANSGSSLAESKSPGHTNHQLPPPVSLPVQVVPNLPQDFYWKRSSLRLLRFNTSVFSCLGRWRERVSQSPASTNRFE